MATIFKKIGRFLSEAMRSRLAWLVVSLHAAWFLLAIANMSPPSREVANFIQQWQGSTVAIFAGRPFHYAYESLPLQLLVLFDLPSSLACIPVGFAMTPLFRLFHIGLFEGSYVGAFLSFVASSLQWLIVGCRFQSWLGSKRWGSSVLDPIHRHFTVLTILIFLFTAISVPIVNARSRRLGFRHAAISFSRP